MPWWQLFCNIEEYQINLLYVLNSHSAICQLKVNKAWGEKKNSVAKSPNYFYLEAFGLEAQNWWVLKTYR